MFNQLSPPAAGSSSTMSDRSLGLRRGIVRLAEHDPQWPIAYAAAAAEIRSATGIPANRIEHVGSTAVPDVPAKPILDIVVGVDDPEDIEPIVMHLVRIGYIDRGAGEGSVGRLLVRESSPNVRTIHVHIVGYGTEDWKDYVVFRDMLRAQPAARMRYAEVKRTLAERFADDRESYRSAKDEYLRKILEDSRAGGSHDVEPD
jgi:GrpB-like predicted nucleotidyltransferase (UPF0157 family)